ncbi:MAG TPA: APC family permease [Actinomycetota bacterium]|nr:APC family permease [Actinomycetota bacterium]
MSEPGQLRVDDYVKGELSKETNWWGAFVVGLAGTILVTGVTAPVLAGLGGAAIPNFIFWTVTGWLLCMFIAELAAMLPDRTGGAPAYAYYAFKDRLPRTYPHINGLTVWMYWLGWVPVMAVNNLLTGSYVPVLFGFTDNTHKIQLFSNSFPVSYFTLIVGAAISIALFVPAFLGIRIGTVFATILGLLSMIPLTILAVAPFFTGDFHSGNLQDFTIPGGGSFFSGHAWFLFIQFSALLTWNVIAMEAAACYIGETRNPDRDAPIAMNLEGGYGVFIYTVLPLAVLGVVGYRFIASSLDINGILAQYAKITLNFGGVDKIVTAAVIIALLLSSLNAIMGCARSLYMMALDGQAPRIFGHVNKHNVPDVSMGLNVVINILLLLVGTPGSIYVLSNVGYVGSFVPVLLGYYFLRKWRPEIHRPYRLPEWMKYVAVAVAALYFFVWAVGIPACAIKGCQPGGGKMFLIGVFIVLLYFPLYLWRRSENRRLGSEDFRVRAPV